jgi:ATP-dependent DNA helicase RecQ
MLLTAHRAKGLEFDHVVVLDGGWDKVGKGEDRDAPRRLFYVAMTRARKTLALARMDSGRNGLLDVLLNDPSSLRREAADLPAPPAELGRRFVRVTLGDVDLGFAGRYALKSPVHKAIAALEVGNPLTLRQREGRQELVDADGNTVGRMARNFVIPPGTEFLSGRVVSIIVRKRDDSGAMYQDQCRCDSWEVVVPELVFSPQS